MNTLHAVNPSRPAPLFHDCPDCGFMAWGRRACLSAGETRMFDERIEHQRLKKHREFLHRAGAPLATLYIITSGFLKTSISDNNGHEQITGFSMTGGVIGMEAIATGRYQCNTIAIEDTSLCGIAFADLEQLNREIPALQQHFHQTLGAEIGRDHGMMLLLGAMRAEERVAVFLLNLSRRFAGCGRSETVFHLPMNRQEIGNYLGLTLETVSRAFSHLANDQLIAIKNKEVEIKNLAGLQQLVRNHR